ncbi:ABC transporter ATP-binding protein [Petroclostridium xylanilyticum]|uniref:ABC transporter ATP-binding protein n=1 Tax=Petroclostridium xylanilyticum TaxID=1792311 RepID=UPI000B99A2EE|nr:ABC transporter ATP-binding protein [Petroclostridium xylanilyticum]
MLKIKNLNTGYGDLKVLFDVSIEVNEGEVVTLVGSNGAGKTTLLRVISGLIPLISGEVLWYDQDISKIPAYKRPELGIAHIPQGRGILGTLTVKENLLMGAYIKNARPKRNERIEYVLNLFPILRERANQMAGTLSGGQQQMLAIARALMMEPKLLILDEPSLGLAPIIVEEVFDIIRNIRIEGVSILLIEQNLLQALSVADRGYVFETGRVVIEGPSRDLLNNQDIKKAYLGI